METLNSSPESEQLLHEKLSEVICSVQFGEGIEVVPVTSEEVVEEIKASNLKSLDFRVKTQGDEATASVFEGLAFDPERLRSQAFVLYDKIENKKTPVGVMTLIIAPRTYAEKELYWERTPSGIILRNFKEVEQTLGIGTEFPEFLVIPAWTKVDPRYLGKFAIPGFRAINKALKVIEDSAPSDTFIEMCAQGMAPRSQEIASLAQTGLGSVVEENILPKVKTAAGEKDLIELFGKNTEGSSSTVKMAKALGLKGAENFASHPTFGPVFIKKVK